MTRHRPSRVLSLAVLAAALGVSAATAAPGSAPDRCQSADTCGRAGGGPAPPAVARGHEALLALGAPKVALGRPVSQAAGRSPKPGAGRKAAAVNAPAVVVSQRPGPWCGGPDWRLFTLSDADRDTVDLRPEDTSIAQIAALASPGTSASRRATAFQRRAWRLRAVVDRYRIGTDGEIALVLFDIPSGRYMNAYLANPGCLSTQTRERRALVAARKALTGHCPRVTPSWQLLGVTARITGVGYWNPVRTTRGALPNGAELRPVTGFQIVSGCGYP